MKRIKKIGCDNWYAAVLWSVLFEIQKIGPSKYMAAHHKKRLMIASPFLITPEDIKINLNKTTSNKRTPHRNFFPKTKKKWDVITKMYLIQNIPRVRHNQHSQASSEKWWNCEESIWLTLAKNCYSLSLSHTHVYAWWSIHTKDYCTSHITSIHGIVCLECLLFMPLHTYVHVRYGKRRWKHFTCRCLSMANTLHCMLHFAKAMYKMLRFFVLKPFSPSKTVLLSSQSVSAPTKE